MCNYFWRNLRHYLRQSSGFIVSGDADICVSDAEKSLGTNPTRTAIIIVVIHFCYYIFSFLSHLIGKAAITPRVHSADVRQSVNAA
jgi:hypothetical protein